MCTLFCQTNEGFIKFTLCEVLDVVQLPDQPNKTELIVNLERLPDIFNGLTEE